MTQNKADSSIPTVRRTIHRDRQRAHERLGSHYFSENALYIDEMFRRRIQMSKRLFQQIVGDLEGEYESFQWLVDGRGKKRLSPIQKCTAAICQLTYGVSSDMMDEYVQLGDKTASDYLNNFCKGSNNEINVPNHSPTLNEAAESITPSVPFFVNGIPYGHGYYLTDGIYPDRAIFVKSFTCPEDKKGKKFKRAQESAWKDIERAFGVLKQRWHILNYPARAVSPARLRHIMYTCLTLHNMILEDEGRVISTIPPNSVHRETENRTSLKNSTRKM